MSTLVWDAEIPMEVWEGYDDFEVIEGLNRALSNINHVVDSFTATTDYKYVYIWNTRKSLLENLLEDIKEGGGQYHIGE